MSMADAPRCWQDIPCFWRMFYPFPHLESLILKYTKIHVEIRGHTDCMNLPASSPAGECVGWPLLGGWPTMASYECWLCTMWVSIVTTPPPLFRQREHSSLHPSPPRTQKVSWTPAQINVPSVPAGVGSGSPGRWGQARLCPTGAACGLVS